MAPACRPQRVRQKLLELRWYTATQLDSFDDRQIVSHIFKPGFSTAGGVDARRPRRRAWTWCRPTCSKLGARILLSSTPGAVHRIQDQVSPAYDSPCIAHGLAMTACSIVDDSNMIRSRISRVVQNGGLAGVSLVGPGAKRRRGACASPAPPSPRWSPWT